MRIDQATCAVMFKHQSVFSFDLLAGDFFRPTEAVSDKLKYQIVIGHVKNNHYQTAFPGRDFEAFLPAL